MIRDSPSFAQNPTCLTARPSELTEISWIPAHVEYGQRMWPMSNTISVQGHGMLTNGFAVFCTCRCLHNYKRRKRNCE